MSVYAKENPEYLRIAIQSIFSQTLLPDEVIIVKDGPIGKNLEVILELFEKKYLGVVKLFQMKTNSGLAFALNKALSLAKGEFIARMDSDDECFPKRFAIQRQFLEKNPEIDVVGSWICEIDAHGNLIKPKVEYPLLHEDCLEFFKKRNPLAHPATFFRKRFFEKIGRGYSLKYFRLPDQDTELWYQGFLFGCKFANVPEVLLKFRRPENFYSRRSGLRLAFNYLRNKIHFNNNLKLGFKANLYAISYFFMMLSPQFIKKILYRMAR
jgi:glycosyltransferase involved in cell wall biosynthesis